MQRRVRRAPLLLLAAALAVLAMTTLGTTSESGTVNLVPGASIADLAQDDNENAVKNVIGNVLLFLPLGFLGVLALDRAVLVVTGLAAVFSVGIELIQLVLGHRWVDVDDVLLNTLGAMLGALAASVSVAVFPAVTTGDDISRNGDAVDRQAND